MVNRRHEDAQHAVPRLNAERRADNASRICRIGRCRVWRSATRFGMIRSWPRTVRGESVAGLVAIVLPIRITPMIACIMERVGRCFNRRRHILPHNAWRISHRAFAETMVQRQRRPLGKCIAGVADCIEFRPFVPQQRLDRQAKTHRRVARHQEHFLRPHNPLAALPMGRGAPPHAPKWQHATDRRRNALLKQPSNSSSLFFTVES